MTTVHSGQSQEAGKSQERDFLALPPQLDTGYQAYLDFCESHYRMRRDMHQRFWHESCKHFYNVSQVRPPARVNFELAVVDPTADAKFWNYRNLAVYISSAIETNCFTLLAICGENPKGTELTEEVETTLANMVMSSLSFNETLRKDVMAAESAYYGRYPIPGYGKDGALHKAAVINAFGTELIQLELHLFPDFIPGQKMLASQFGGPLRRKGAIQIKRINLLPGCKAQYTSEYRTISWSLLNESGKVWRP